MALTNVNTNLAKVLAKLKKVTDAWIGSVNLVSKQRKHIICSFRHLRYNMNEIVYTFFSHETKQITNFQKSYFSLCILIQLNPNSVRLFWLD